MHIDEINSMPNINYTLTHHIYYEIVQQQGHGNEEPTVS